MERHEHKTARLERVIRGRPEVIYKVTYNGVTVSAGRKSHRSMADARNYASRLGYLWVGQPLSEIL